MKRKGRRPKTSTSFTNGTTETQDESINGPIEELEVDNSKERSAKRKSATVKPADVSKNENLQNDESIENITQNGQSAEDADEGKPEPKKRRTGGKRKSSAKPVEEHTEDAEDVAQYEVEAILDEKMIRGVRHYLIRWKGYEPESDSWEPETTLSCAELIAAFKAKQKKRGNKKSKSKSPLKRKNSVTTITTTTWNENDKFEVDRILDVYFKKNGAREFLVSWKGYPMSESTWEPEENMDCPELIEKFMEKVENAKKIEKRELRINRPHTDRFTLTMLSRQRRLSKRNEGKQRVQYHDAE